MGKSNKYLSKIMECEKMKDIKISLICTLKNEESSIRELLDSILSQSRLPDEVVILDGGSTDKTVEIINSYIGKCDLIKLIVKKGANIAEGRNIAIKNAEYDIIASTDVGCRLDKNWLNNLIKPFEEDRSVDVVSGWYEADAITEFEKCVAEVTYPKLKMVLKNPDKFLPSSRSIAFKKKCWEKVGGYPKWLYTAEDTLFDLNLKKKDCKFAFAPDAVVYWRVRSNSKDVFKQYYLYAKGDGRAGIFVRKYLKHNLIYLLGFTLLLLGFYHWLFWELLISGVVLYYFFRLSKKKIFKKKMSNIILAIKIMFIIDMAQISGWFKGFIFGKINKKDDGNQLVQNRN